MRILGLIIDALVKFVAVFGISTGVLVAFVNVMARYGFNYSFTWAAELTVYMFLWSMFFTSLVQSISKPVAKVIFIFTQTVSLVFLSVVAYFGYEYILLMIRIDEMSPDLGIPMWIPYLMVPVAFVIGVYYLVVSIIETIKTPAEELKFGHSEEEDMLKEAEAFVKKVETKTGGML
jgi:C4-dicarboxylate transporter DctQ subunit